MDRIRKNYQPYVMGGEVQPIDGTWFVRVRPYIVRYPNGVTFQLNRSTQLEIGRHAVDYKGSQRWVGVFLDLSKREIFTFSAICEFTGNIGDPIDVSQFVELAGKDLVVLADIFLSYGQAKVDEDCISHNRRGEFLMSAASQKSEARNLPIEDRLEFINNNGLPGDLAESAGSDYQIINKSVGDYPMTIGGDRSGIFSFIESPIGDKFISIQGPIRCRGTDTTCGLGDVCGGLCDSVDTTCMTANDIVVAQVSDHCDDPCEVGCQVVCQASAQSTCQTVCECGHEYVGTIPAQACATCNTAGCEACEPACEICESPAGHDTRTDRRCYWASELPDSEFFIPCSSCDNVSDPHNLATCVSCDVQCDAVCQVPDTRTGSFEYYDCSGGAGSLDVSYVNCPTTCENPPSCVSTWQTTCHVCQTGCKCNDQNCWEVPPPQDCVAICSGSDVLIVGDSHVVPGRTDTFVERSYDVIIGPNYDLVDSEVEALEFYQWNEHINNDIITRQAIKVSGWLNCDWPGRKVLGVGCTAPANNIEFTILSKKTVTTQITYGLPVGNWYIVLETVTPSQGGRLQAGCEVPDPPLKANINVEGGNITQVAVPSSQVTWERKTPGNVMITIWGGNLRLVSQRKVTVTVRWECVPDPTCPLDTPCSHCDIGCQNQVDRGCISRNEN